MDINIVEELLSFTLIGAEWVLWLLLFLSVISIGVMLERTLYFFLTRVNFSYFSESLSNYLHKNNFEDATKYCADGKSLEEKVAYIGLHSKSKNKESIEAIMESMIIQEKQKMDRGLVILGTLGNNAPFIGLFGTVIGIIKAFNDLALNPDGGPSVVMAGVSEALVATAVGILVAIPAVIAFNFFNRIIRKHVANAESLIKTITSTSKNNSPN